MFGNFRTNLLLASLITYAGTIYPFVSYTLMSRGTQKILLLGDVHSATYNAINEAHMNALIEQFFQNKKIIESNKLPINCFVEMHSAKIQEPTYRLAKTFDMLRNYINSKSSNLLNFIMAETRDLEAPIFNYIIANARNNLEASLLEFQALLPKIADVPNYQNYTLGQFLKSNQARLLSITNWFGKDHPNTKKFKKFTKAVILYFDKIDQNMPLIKAISTTLCDVKTSEEFTLRFTRITSFIHGIESWFDFSVLHQSLQLVNIQKEERVMFILGGFHVDNLTPLLLKEGFKIDSAESCYTPAPGLKYDFDASKFEAFGPKIIEASGKFFEPTCVIASKNCSACTKTEPATAAAAKFKRCGQCKLVWYCNAECQKVDWPTHKLVCKKPASATVSSDGKYSVDN